MAFKKDLKADNDCNDFWFDIDGVYFKVVEILINIKNNKVIVGVGGYGSEEARKTNGASYVFKERYEYTLKDFGFSNTKLLGKAYKLLKKHNDFKDAEDI